VKNGVRVFLAVFIALGLSWCGFVLAPARQLGGAKQTMILNSSDVYPVGRPGDANQGLQIYRANGCAACHTEQVRQTGVDCDVVLTDIGKKPKAVSIRMAQMKLNGLSREAAGAVVDQITGAGGNAEIHIVATGPDIERGWGKRQSVAEDFLYDYPVQPGSLRAGPDLSNLGVSKPDLNWQLVHLYAPSSEVKDSTMPPFRYLFEVRKINGSPSPDALVFPKGFEPSAGYEIMPTPAAKELAAYLLSLRANMPLYDAPFTP